MENKAEAFFHSKVTVKAYVLSEGIVALGFYLAMASENAILSHILSL